MTVPAGARVRAFVVDAFTAQPFRGNPAGVVLLDGAGRTEFSDRARLAIAAEFRHSETAFVAARDDGDYDLRWFTPIAEVDLCGHATLASAHALAGVTGRRDFGFRTRSGRLTAHVGADGVITLDFPAQHAAPAPVPAQLAGAVGTAVPAVLFDGADYVVDLADAQAVAALDPDPDALAGIECRGVTVTAPAGPGADHDFVSRFFAPRVGVPEDPVTGSAHCTLGPLWARRLGRTTLTGVQLSARGGRVGVEVRGPRVLLSGTAVTVLDGMVRTA